MTDPPPEINETPQDVLAHVEGNEGSLPKEGDVPPGGGTMQTAMDKIQGEDVRRSERKKILTPKGKEKS